MKEKIYVVKWTSATRVFALVLTHNHTWQLIVCNSKVWTHNHWNRHTCSIVIKDAVHENYERDHDLLLLNTQAFVSTESL